MNIALSPARASVDAPRLATGRHPLGVTIVIALHVLVAGALLTAHSLRRPVAETKAVDLLPEPVRPSVVKPVDEPPPPPVRPHLLYVTPPEFQVDPVQPVVTGTDAPHGPHPDYLPTPLEDQHVAAVADPPRRFTPHVGSLNANAAQCRPEYPAAAQRAGATGVSHIRFTIDASGKVTNARILQPSGPTREHRLLDQAAAAALAQCPAVVGNDEAGHAVASTADVDYVWSLQ